MTVPPAYGTPPPENPPPGDADPSAYPPYPPYPDASSHPPYPYPYPAPYPPPYPSPYPYSARTNTLAIASLVCAFVFAPLGIVFGHLSLSQIRKSGEDGRGLAIAGLIIGYVVTIGTVLLLIAGVLFFSWAAKVVRDNPEFRGAARPIGVSGALPPFQPPPGLGAACDYPPTATPAAKPVKPPRRGPVPTDPAVVDVTMTVADGTTEGTTVGLRLDNAKAPCTVNSLVSLAQQGFFDDTGCHRLTTSVLQCGDPTGTGAGGPGYRFVNEYPTNQYRPLDRRLQQPVTYPRGTLAMANAGPDSNGSQFFIVYRDTMLPPTYTVFGSIDETGMNAVDRIVSVGVSGEGADGRPKRPIVIESMRLS